MKIGIITSGNENLTLFNFLNKFDHEYVIYYDQINRPYGDKQFLDSLNFIEKGVDFLIKKGVDKIILPPVYELYFLEHKKGNDIILPLFRQYVLDCVFKNSLVGKIGMFGDYADVEVAQDLIYNLSKDYKLTENQSKIKKFCFPFNFWAKEVQMRKYFSRKLSFSDLMSNRVIKFDLRYFKDANVDSLTPLNYEYFNYQNTIFKFFNQKKQRFYKLQTIEELFGSFDLKKSEKYGVDVYFNGHVDFLKREKKNLWNLQRGKSVEINFIKI